MSLTPKDDGESMMTSVFFSRDDDLANVTKVREEQEYLDKEAARNKTGKPKN